MPVTLCCPAGGYGVEFQLLGPVEARVGGRLVPLGGLKPRALLAALLLERGRVVPVDRLVDIIWGQDPPKTARGAIQAYVKNLRRAFASVGALRVTSGFAGECGSMS